MLNPSGLKNGCEQCEEYRDAIRRRKMVQYDYRAENGKLFSCVRRSLQDCQAARDQWLKNQMN